MQFNIAYENEVPKEINHPKKSTKLICQIPTDSARDSSTYCVNTFLFGTKNLEQ